MQHEGGFRLDDVRHIQEDDALRTVLGIDQLPQATTLGDWLRRLGAQPHIQDAWVKVNRALLQSALHCCKQVTLDIDATEIVAHKAIVHWYNQRAEDSENRLKELKLDFSGDVLPCSDFHANALYFLITALSYNLFALMRQLLPGDLAQHRAITIRGRLYAIAAKVVKTGRQLFVKLREKHRAFLEQVLLALKEFESPPI